LKLAAIVRGSSVEGTAPAVGCADPATVAMLTIAAISMALVALPLRIISQERRERL